MSASLQPGERQQQRQCRLDPAQARRLLDVNPLVAAGLMAMLFRAELARPGMQFVDNQTFNGLVSVHAALMIFLFVIPAFAGLGNYVIPLMIGAPDMAFPRLNALSFWLLPIAGSMMLLSFLVPGGAFATGWTSYAPLATDLADAEAIGLYQEAYDHEPFVRVLESALPETKATLGSNFCDVAVKVNRQAGMAIAIAAIDNLGKGAAGQAVQNMNLMCGLPEESGLKFPGIYP